MLDTDLRNRILIDISGNVVKQMVNAIACTIELWYTREVAKHERSVRVARGDSHSASPKPKMVWAGLFKA